MAGKQELKIFVLPIFVDVEKIKNAPVTIDMHKKYPGHDFILLMMSRFTKEKNIPTAIRAVGELKKECPTILLIITGNGPEKINIESIIKNQKLQNNVIVEEWTGDIASYYKTADAFLLFSAYEGYGRAIIEATIAGCPVIMTDVGVAGDVICNGENGIIIPVGDTEALKKAILDLYKNRKKGIGMGERAQRDVARHLYASKQEYLQMYKKSLEQCLE
ncbi:MAG: glycosyltransferase family 4 protein [bacterium]|nr:glycosyltransferase family 4 protein [bacterium]